MLTPAPNLHVYAHDISHVPFALLTAAHASGRMPYARTETVVGELDELSKLVPPDGRVVCSHLASVVVVELDGALLKIKFKHGTIDIAVVAVDRATTDRVVDRAVALAQELVTPPAPSKVRISVWWCDGRPESIVRGIDSGHWSEIAHGYPVATRSTLEQLMIMPRVSEDDGRLILWHGEPGTGKTTAVRALARAWGSWCDVHYVSDPERLFATPGYLLTVAGDLKDRADDDRWRLIVAEDCDEYLRTDAKHRAGASLGRLLNLSDGILGNGLRVLVLLSTNEEVGRLHPAITRPGRCLSQVRFERFSYAEAQAWLGAGLEPTADQMTLAELHALRAGRQQADDAEMVTVGGYL